MQEVTMKYGNSEISFPIDNAKSITYINPIKAASIENLHNTFLDEVENNTVASPALSKLVEEDDKITIVVSDITRLWSRQDLVCKELVEYLNTKCGIAFDNMVIVVALGTHRAQTEEENRKNVGEWVHDRVKVVCHSPESEVYYIGTTSYGTEVEVNTLTKDRKTIFITSTVHHRMSGFGGGRKSVLPGISSKKTILSNHLMCLEENAPRSNDLIGMGKLETNPVHLDMTEASKLLNPLFGINIVVNSEGKLSSLVCGDFFEAFLKSCDIVNDIASIKIAEKADVVIASCGGYPKDINLYQGVKTLFNMAEAVKDGGTMIFIAECVEGGGSPDFFDWVNNLRNGTLDADLRKGFTIGGYIFYASLESINKGEVLAVTSLAPEVLADMNIKGFKNIEELIKTVDFTNKSVYLMPFGGSTVPYLAE